MVRKSSKSEAAKTSLTTVEPFADRDYDATTKPRINQERNTAYQDSRVN